MKKYKVLQIGPSINMSKGGMASVLRDMKKNDLFNDRTNIKFYSSFEDGSLLKRIFFTFKMILGVDKYIKDADIVHIHVTKDGSTFRKMIYASKCRKYGKKYIYHIHNCEIFLEFYNKQNRITKRKIKKSFMGASYIFCLSNRFSEEVKTLFETENCIFMPNGIDLNVYSPIDEYSFGKEPMILFLGKIRENKGIYDLIHALKIVDDKGVPYKAIIAGTGEVNEAALLARKLKTNNIRFVGWLEGKKKLEYLQHSNILALPSYYEGFPIAILEAMATNNVVLATDTGANSEILDANQIVPMRSPEKLAEQIEYWLLNEKAAKKKAAENLERVKKYDSSIIYSAICDIYEKMLNE